MRAFAKTFLEEIFLCHIWLLMYLLVLDLKKISRTWLVIVPTGTWRLCGSLLVLFSSSASLYTTLLTTSKEAHHPTKHGTRKLWVKPEFWTVQQMCPFLRKKQKQIETARWRDRPQRLYCSSKMSFSESLRLLRAATPVRKSALGLLLHLSLVWANSQHPTGPGGAGTAALPAFPRDCLRCVCMWAQKHLRHVKVVFRGRERINMKKYFTCSKSFMFMLIADHACAWITLGYEWRPADTFSYFCPWDLRHGRVLMYLHEQKQMLIVPLEEIWYLWLDIRYLR